MNTAPDVSSTHASKQASNQATAASQRDPGTSEPPKYCIFLKKNLALKSSSKVCREGLFGDSRYAGGPVGGLGPGVAIFKGQLAVGFEGKVENL